MQYYTHNDLNVSIEKSKNGYVFRCFNGAELIERQTYINIPLKDCKSNFNRLIDGKFFWNKD